MSHLLEGGWYGWRKEDAMVGVVGRLERMKVVVI